MNSPSIKKIFELHAKAQEPVAAKDDKEVKEVSPVVVKQVMTMKDALD